MDNQDYVHQGSSIGQLVKRYWLLTGINIKEIKDDALNGAGGAQYYPTTDIQHRYLTTKKV